MTSRLSRHQAAQITVTAQMLAKNLEREATPADVRQVVDRLGLIQIDTIHVVARSQYVIPWSRIGSYQPNWLDLLHFPERQLFEYWGHAASLIDANLLPFFLSRMNELNAKYHPDRHPWTAENADVIQSVLERISAEGPLTTLAFERPNPTEPVALWEWHGGKPTTRALEYLWLTGEVGIHRRINFRREYDLLKRVHPEIATMQQADVFQERLALADRALRAIGIARSEWLNDYFRTKWGNRNDRPPGPHELLAMLAQQGRAIPVEIDELGQAFVHIEQEPTLRDVESGFVATKTTLLSPFDNLIWDRQRTMELFNFEYRIECYTPAPKRKYGYFSLPILRRGSLVGRVDPKMDRKSGQFIMKSLHLEPGVEINQGLIEDLRGTLHAFARWNGATHIVSENVAAELAASIDGPLS